MKKTQEKVLTPAHRLLSYTMERSLTLDQRERFRPALRPVAAGGLCVVMACADREEADQVGRHLWELNTGCLVTYLRAGDLMLNTPSGRVALVILATRESVPVLRRTLEWLRRRWPSCPITVVGDAGCGDHEMAAREGGAVFLARPVTDQQWLAILSHSLGIERRPVLPRKSESAQADTSKPTTG